MQGSHSDRSLGGKGLYSEFFSLYHSGFMAKFKSWKFQFFFSDIRSLHMSMEIQDEVPMASSGLLVFANSPAVKWRVHEK